ncbi:MAG: hypothetical protein NT014_01935 [Candidatus Omnitrophica bacterium]|nr:hypothetical protein [Candidatus Omnitrophota bacterium]
MEPQNQYRSVIPSYLDNPVLKPRNFYETGLEESLEKIVLHDEPQKERGLIDKIFSDRSRTLKATIKALFNEVLTREHLNSVLLRDIDSELCKTGSYLEQIHDATKRQYTHDLELAFSGRRTQLESRLLDLTKQKRDEYLPCWKDLAYLSKGLLVALKDYWDMSHKAGFMYEENAA